MGGRKAIITLLLVCILAIVFLPVSAVAEEEDPIKVGYFVSFNDFIDDIDDLNSPGYGYEVFEKIEEISDLSFEYVPIEGSLTEALINGTVDVAGYAIRTDDRRDDVVFAEYPHSKTYAALTTPDFSIRYNTPESIDGKTVATYDDNYAQQFLDNYCRRNNISVTYIYGEVHNYTEMEADFYITYTEDRNTAQYNNVLNLGVFNMYVMGRIGEEYLIDQIDTVFNQVINTEGNFFMELEQEYLSHNIEINHRSLTAREVEVLRQRPLEVGYISHYQPLSYINDQGEPAGAMVDTMNIFAERYGFEVNYHPYSLSEDPKLHEDFDVLLTIYGDGEHDTAHYDATDSYYTIPMYAQVRQTDFANISSFSEMLARAPKIGTLSYQFINFDFYLQEHPDSEFIVYHDWHAIMDDFADGELDMFIHTESALPYVEQYLDGTDRIAVNSDIENAMKFFISKDISDDYLPIFNIMLDRLTQRDYTELILTNSSEYYPEESILDLLFKYWYYFVMLAFVALAAFVTYAYEKEKKNKIQLKIAHETDSMTGFIITQRFRETLQEILVSANPKEYEVIAFDVDMFRTINTHFSAERGNEVILAIAESLRKAFENTSAIISRKVADQFLIMRKVGDGGTMKHIYDTVILPSVRDVLSEKYNISMSFGNVIIEDCKEDATAIVGMAETAKARGKRSHKTTFITFDEKLRKLYSDRINITFRMEQALKDGEFYVEYQPKIKFNTLKIGGAEALVRWNPTLGEKIYPDEFIPVFEKNGFIETIDLFVLEEVCKFIKATHKKIKLPRISVNLSAHTILSGSVISRVSDIISTYEIHPDSIEMELTESAVEEDPKTFLQRIKQLKKIGFLISIDDFGAGVSSLNRLSSIEADVLKLDKAFFDIRDQGAKSTTVVVDIVNMAKHLDMQVVAEGVETASQAFWLKNIACDYAQGYYFSKSISEDEFKELLLADKQYEILIG